MYRLPGWKAFADSLKALTPEQRSEFWRDTHQKDGPALKTFLEESDNLITRYQEEETATGRGEYLQLGVYEAQGYPVDRIKALCTDTKEDRVLGTLYKVDILRIGSSTSQVRASQTTLTRSGSSEAASTPEGTSNPPEGTSNPPEPPKPGEKDLKTQVCVATKALAKISSVLVPLHVMLRNKLVSELPEFARTAAKETLNQLLELQTSCKKALSGRTLVDINQEHCADLVAHLFFSSGGSEFHSIGIAICCVFGMFWRSPFYTPRSRISQQGQEGVLAEGVVPVYVGGLGEDALVARRHLTVAVAALVLEGERRRCRRKLCVCARGLLGTGGNIARRSAAKRIRSSTVVSPGT